MNLFQSLDWTYSYGDVLGDDQITQDLFNSAEKPLFVTIDLGKASLFMFSYLNEFSKEISIGFKNSYTDPKFAGNYTITILLTNFLKQTSATRITVELVPVYDTPFNN